MASEFKTAVVTEVCFGGIVQHGWTGSLTWMKGSGGKLCFQQQIC